MKECVYVLIAAAEPKQLQALRGTHMLAPLRQIEIPTPHAPSHIFSIFQYTRLYRRKIPPEALSRACCSPSRPLPGSVLPPLRSAPESPLKILTFLSVFKILLQR